MEMPIDWLLEGDPWIEYRTRRDLLGRPEDDLEVLDARESMLASPQVRHVLAELAEWPGSVVSSHKNAGLLLHKLTFVADLGLRVGDPGVDEVVARVLEHRSADGPFQVPMNIPAHFGGTGLDQPAWALCDTPLIVSSLTRFGLGRQRVVQAAIEYLEALIRDNGWPCAVSKELGTFRGPGRKDDPCPFANLAMLKALSASPALRETAPCHVGANTLLTLWADSMTRHPYQFYMGTDFRKLKAPLVWYDLLHVLDVLSRFSWLQDDPRLLDMLALLKGKADRQGRFTPESVWMAWRGWEFAQKKEPSRWLTLLAWRIIQRVETGSA